MLKRKVYDKLVEWKTNKNQECLLVKGARQIGKTFIIEKFGKENYESYIYLNFYRNPEHKAVFEGSLDAEQIYKRISLYVNDVKFVDKNTLIFLDEIQDCPNARTALKFLAIDNRYDVIASGSLLGLHYKEMISIPVGYERTLEMYSLDFEEFLWAVGKSSDAVTVLKSFFDNKEKVDNGIHEQFMELLREYLVVGGMPEVVNTFLKTNNFQDVYATQKKIMESYQEDIKHYASTTLRQKISDCYNSIPRQLAKEYTKFQYKVVSKEGNARRYDSCLNWLVDAGMIKMCFNVSTPQFPLVAYEKPDQFKVYVTDIGLLTSLYGFETQVALLKDTLTGPAKGGIYENLVFDMLIKRGFNLNYYKNDNNTQEIEFVYVKDGSVIPIEVKAKNRATISLNNFISEYKPPYAYKLISGNLGVNEVKITLPLYMALFI
ncbi:MAG: ATP-binding protein [Lachnospiraceae bacterium]|nr:ATP-binding protein [Lachnospiraceae bacterium]